MLKQNFLKEKLKSGNAVIGTWSVIPSAVVADVISSSGVDFIVIDSEHGPIHFESAQQMVMACESRGVSPLMRVSGVNEAEILKALDIGVHGVHIPNVKTSDDVRKVVESAYFPPSGQRGFSPFNRGGGYSHSNSKQIMDEAKENILVVVHVEGEEVAQRIEEILSEPGVDIVFIGLYDLSKSLGLAGQVDHPRVLKILEELVLTINLREKISGTIATSIEQAQKFLEIGVRYITFSADCEMLQRVYRSLCDSLKMGRYLK